MTLRVYITEDNQDIGDALVELLQFALPIEILGVASTEQEAVDFLLNNEVDVAIFDIMLAQGNGLNVLKAARPNKTGVWIVFSNHSRQSVIEACRAYGADHVMDKSNELDSLIALLTRIEERKAK